MAEKNKNTIRKTLNWAKRQFRGSSKKKEVQKGGLNVSTINSELSESANNAQTVTNSNDENYMANISTANYSMNRYREYLGYYEADDVEQSSVEEPQPEPEQEAKSDQQPEQEAQVETEENQMADLELGSMVDKKSNATINTESDFSDVSEIPFIGESDSIGNVLGTSEEQSSVEEPQPEPEQEAKSDQQPEQEAQVEKEENQMADLELGSMVDKKSNATINTSVDFADVSEIPFIGERESIGNVLGTSEEQSSVKEPQPEPAEEAKLDHQPEQKRNKGKEVEGESSNPAVAKEVNRGIKRNRFIMDKAARFKETYNEIKDELEELKKNNTITQNSIIDSWTKKVLNTCETKISEYTKISDRAFDRLEWYIANKESGVKNKEDYKLKHKCDKRDEAKFKDDKYKNKLEELKDTQKDLKRIKKYISIAKGARNQRNRNRYQNVSYQRMANNRYVTPFNFNYASTSQNQNLNNGIGQGNSWKM